MRAIGERNLDKLIADSTQPLLGICLGMQVLFEHSEESDVACLGLIPGRVTRLPEAPGIRVPHMGWAEITKTRPSPLLDGTAPDARGRETRRSTPCRGRTGGIAISFPPHGRAHPHPRDDPVRA